MKYHVTNIIFDAELSGKTSKSMFAIAMSIENDDKRSNYVWYFKEDEKVDEENGHAFKWWMKNEKRKEFYHHSHQECLLQDKKDVAADIRYILDECYDNSKKVIFWGDFKIFDLGMINGMLTHYNHLPVYYSDKTIKLPPATCVDYCNYLNGLAGLPPTAPSSQAFKELGIVRPKVSISHNSAKDIDILMDTVQLIRRYIGS